MAVSKLTRALAGESTASTMNRLLVVALSYVRVDIDQAIKVLEKDEILDKKERNARIAHLRAFRTATQDVEFSEEASDVEVLR